MKTRDKISNEELDKQIFKALEAYNQTPIVTYVIANIINQTLFENKDERRTNTSKVRRRLKKLELSNLVEVAKTSYVSQLSWRIKKDIKDRR